MARRVRKTGMSREHWRNVFRQAVAYCKEHKGSMKFQQCVSEYLRGRK